MPKQLQHGVVGHGDVVRIARQRRPAERAGTLAEQRPDKSGTKPRNLEGLGHAPPVGHLAAEIVAVVEGDRAVLLVGQHRADVLDHRVEHGVS